MLQLKPDPESDKEVCHQKIQIVELRQPCQLFATTNNFWTPTFFRQSLAI